MSSIFIDTEVYETEMKLGSEDVESLTEKSGKYENAVIDTVSEYVPENWIL